MGDRWKKCLLCAAGLSIALLIFYYFELILVWIQTCSVPFVPIRTDRNIIDHIIHSQNQTPTKLYYINLARSAERNRTFLNRLDDTIIPMRVDAESPESMPPIVRSFKCRHLINTEWACLASHLKAIHMAYHNGEKFAFIAEDDLIINYNIDWNALIQSAPPNWDILQIHSCCIKMPNSNMLSYYKNNSNLWLKSDGIVPSCAFYIMNRAIMKKILAQYVIGYENAWQHIKGLDFSTTQIVCQADLILFHNTNRYICTYPLASIDTLNASTISWTHHLNSNNFK